ncbi:hypothetical protein [Acidipropionibacterium virtanenii]|uniref:Uncharacterized protein n=1 Tax=Acidipropionibacterium virtanenii TaxID=2057246 RepID=A0A344UY84_9ACTN|nr:hypothetical protein [Acidipropionibacterium virtanenii]AXE40232.1 hypothetical protein JS278_03098 [Acidipropionibacterium virtanenii]
MTRSAEYVGAYATELEAATAGDRAAGGISQKVLFRHRGTVELTTDRLVLNDWSDGPLRLPRSAVIGLARTYTDLYGRFVGGLLDAGKPLIVDTTEGRIYLLIDHKGFMETNRNKAWEEAIREWLA